MFITSYRHWRAMALVASLFITPAALAHAHLKGQYPAADANVDAAPQALTLNFSEGIEPAFSGIQVTDARKQIIKTGVVKRNEKDNRQMIVPLEQPLTSGKYTVSWHVVSVDGHKTRGQYTFSVK
ncbi:CopC domain-containing protein YobA [Kosakonia sp. H02]|nr:CopC domain-containing protein YobA [Kosakonia sp. H02]